MQNGRPVCAVFRFFFVFLILSSSQAYGENLFRWTDDTGSLCFSNVSPPGGMKAYRMDTVSHSVPDRSGPLQTSTDAGSGEKMPKEVIHIYSDLHAAFLEKRIEERKKSIAQIIALLQKHPNDKALRKKLFEKKQHLFEDLNRLKQDRL